MYLGVIGQGFVGFGDGRGQISVAAIGAMRPEQGVVVRHRFAVDEGLGDVAALGQLRLDPFRVDVAPETGDELMLLATLEKEKTFRVELTQVAARPPFFGVRRIPQVTQQRRTLDQHFAVLGQPHFDMRRGD